MCVCVCAYCVRMCLCIRVRLRLSGRVSTCTHTGLQTKPAYTQLSWHLDTPYVLVSVFCFRVGPVTTPSDGPLGFTVDAAASAPFIQSLHLDRFRDAAEVLLQVH